MRKLVWGALLVVVAAPASARTFCCEAGGRMVCDEGVPPACVGRAYRELGTNGQTIRTYEAPLTPEQQAKRDAELAKKKEEEAKRAEEERKNRILLGTYSSVRDIDLARDRVIGDLEKARDQAKQRLADAEKKKKKLDSESEFYKDHALPASLKSQIRENETDLAAQKKNIADREQDIEAARARFDDDKKRFIALTGAPSEPTAKAGK